MARKRKAPENTEPVIVRATVSLAGFPAGRLAIVSPADPWIAEALAAKWLVIEDEIGVPPQLRSD